MIALATGSKIPPAERVLLTRLIDHPLRGRLICGSVELKSGRIWANALSLACDAGTLKLAAVTIDEDDRRNCRERIGAAADVPEFQGGAEIELLDGWVRDISVLTLLENEFLEECDAGVLITSYSNEYAFIYLTDPAEPELDCLAFSPSAPVEWLQRGWEYTSTNLATKQT